MAARVALLFSFTTNPSDTVAASAHSGGWSESHWTGNFTITPGGAIDRLAQARAAFLPVGCSVVGFRYESFTISGNALLPGGATSGRFRYPGGVGTINLPQDALMFSGTTGTGPNAARFSCRGIPDGQIANGEFQPDATFANAVSVYTQRLITDQWGFIGRIRTNPVVRVNSINAGVVTLSGSIGGTDNVSFLRFLHVVDDAGKPVKGAFLITSHTGNVYTCSGLAGHTLTRPNGNARIDEVTTFLYNQVLPIRAVARKVGAPFERYRGRASRRR